MSNGSLVDPSLELIDPCPDIHALFIQFNSKFFGGALACCEVKWSPRMYSCAGICSYEIRGGRGGLCSIRLSLPLLKLRPRKDLVETLLHEMIHAYLFVKERNRDRDGHGPQFQAHMNRINAESGTRISIYHSFHGEVALYKQHWWRCDGVCKDRRPFFGYIKRSSNRTPGPNDLWWSQHQQSCGGKFIKIKEPEGYGQKKRRTKTDDKTNIPAKKASPPPKVTLDDYYVKIGGKKVKKTDIDEKKDTKVVPFSGNGKKLGGSVASINPSEKSIVPFSGNGQRLGGGGSVTSNPRTSSTVSKKPPNPKVEEVITIGDSDDEIILETPTTSSNTRTNPNWTTETHIGDFDIEEDDALEISFVIPAISDFTTIICPSCNEKVLEERLNDHLDHCLG